MDRFSKPTTGAFVLSADKEKEFIEKSVKKSDAALLRFERHQPKPGVRVPNK
ncbi:MAG: hypothetical protein KBT11_02235 [Treponema sp.]|nr:hypothetical protein [Candidatus Treponema equifaecale]